MAYNVASAESYIRQAAAKRGINPDIAVRVARSEGLANGVYQSNVAKAGVREPSYGPFQLLVGGKGTPFPAGMGNDFIQRTGLDPRDPSTVPQQIEFALDHAANNGWGAWYGAAKVGVGKRDGIGGERKSFPAHAPTIERAAAEAAGQDPTSTASIQPSGTPPMPNNYGGLGGLGGAPSDPEPQTGIKGFFAKNPEMSDALQAIGLSLMSSPGNAPLQNVGEYLPAIQRSRSAAEDRALEREQQRQDRLALSGALQMTGMSPEQAQAFSASPTAASTAIAAKQSQEAKAKTNRTIEYARANYPEIAGMIDAGLPVDDAFRLMAKQREDASAPADLGLNPQYGVDAQGNPVLIQIGKNGKAVQTALPEGVTLSKEPIKLDAGTHFVLLDPITRQPVGQIPKDNYQEAFQKGEGGAAGKARADATAGLGGAEQNADMILGMIDSLDKDPYLEGMLGPIDSRMPNVSEDAARVQSKMDQIGGQTFLQAFESLKGAGQITEIEGQKATAAMARLNTAQSPTDYRQALDELRGIVRAGVQRSRGKAGQEPIAPATTGAGSSSPASAPSHNNQDSTDAYVLKRFGKSFKEMTIEELKAARQQMEAGNGQ